jgi:uncharacterized 2Fe-2S/4Fe-4S cluster protein (DUF4445 family)
LSSSEKYAIAIDLGTTTLAAALVRLPDGGTVARRGCLNPQRCHGLDVIARLEYAVRATGNLREMQLLINNALSRLTEELLVDAAIESAAVKTVAIAANPTMSHLLLALPVDSIAHPPYRPRITAAHNLHTRELGWESDFPLYVFPSPGGFVGGDTVAFLYGLGLQNSLFSPQPATRNPKRNLFPEPALFLDLGTNGEIALLADGKLSATSAAAGPAFEGGNLVCGMAALPGAISSVEAHSGRLVTATVDNARPQGLCGSGVLDTVALLLNEGLLDATGRLLESSESASPLGSRLQKIDGEGHFVLYRDASTLLSLSQGDIRQIQLAKGAVRAGMEVLFERAGIAAEDLQKVVLTGSFGASLRLESLKTVGVLPESVLKNTGFVREGALAGVIRALTEPDSAGQLDTLAGMLNIIPLSGTPLFESLFMSNINFPSQQRSN